jgi:hypothetical protein
MSVLSVSSAPPAGRWAFDGTGRALTHSRSPPCPRGSGAMVHRPVPLPSRPVTPLCTRSSPQAATDDTSHSLHGSGPVSRFGPSRHGSLFARVATAPAPLRGASHGRGGNPPGLGFLRGGRRPAGRAQAGAVGGDDNPWPRRPAEPGGDRGPRGPGGGGADPTRSRGRRARGGLVG